MKNEKLWATLAFLGATAAFEVGCVGHAQATGYGQADAPVVFTDAPTLVEVDSDVWVVADYDYPVYYVGGFYWVYRDNVWYRAHSYDGGWARVEVNVVPVVIARRDHHAYIHYRGNGTARTRPAPRDHDGERHEHADRHDNDQHDNDRHDNDRHDNDRHDNDRHDNDRHDNDRHDNDRPGSPGVHENPGAEREHRGDDRGTNGKKDDKKGRRDRK